MNYAEEIKKYSSILENEKYKELENYIAHGRTTTYKHSIDVAKLSLKIADKLKINVKTKRL